jgi:hypothetical protein
MVADNIIDLASSDTYYKMTETQTPLQATAHNSYSTNAGMKRYPDDAEQNSDIIAALKNEDVGGSISHSDSEDDCQSNSGGE